MSPSPPSIQAGTTPWEEGYDYPVLDPIELGLSELLLLSPFFLTEQSVPRLSPGNSATLCLIFQKEGISVIPCHGFDSHLYLSPKPKAKFTIFFPCPPSSWPHSVTCSIILLWQLQIPASFLNLYSSPSISPKPSANVSFRLSSRHTWLLLYALKSVTGITFADIN